MPSDFSSARTPTVTIGLPVYNGESYLEMALHSLLAQTFPDFEIVISDNASTDGTQSICERAARQDGRIVYIRQPVNLGAAPNFNLLVDHARAPYFKWAAADDLHAPDYLEKCLALLSSAPDAVLCHSEVIRIDGVGNEIELRRPDRAQCSPDLLTRFRSLVPMRPCHAVFGLMRTDAIRHSRRILGTSHGDGILLLELGTMGRFEFVAESLFYSRVHEGQSSERYASDRAAYTEWFDRRRAGKTVLPYWRMIWEFARIGAMAPAGPLVRARCVSAAFGYGWTKRRLMQSEVKRYLRMQAMRLGLRRSRERS
jgi:glycosyltransferase involved in cell wall biosynthesis